MVMQDNKLFESQDQAIAYRPDLTEESNLVKLSHLMLVLMDDPVLTI